MTILEFNPESNSHLLMFHASCMTWEFLKNSIDILASTHHVIVPVMPGYNMDDDSDYTSVEEIAKETEDYLIQKNITKLDGIYGISMGGSIVIRMLANGRIQFEHAIIDAGITPYQLPACLAKMFVIRDFTFMMTLKNSLKFLSMFVPVDKYGVNTFDRLRKVMLHASTKTIWNNFNSCNTYSMPNPVMESKTRIHYWYGSKEKMNRKRDVKYVKKIFPNIIVEEIPGFNHAEFVMLKPDAFAGKVNDILENSF